jgi:uncharacterized membrane protein
VYKGLSRLALVFFTWHSLRVSWHGKEQIHNQNDFQYPLHMPKLWKAVLTVLQEVGDRSGCHQLPERSLKIRSYTFPVCARCTGVFLGQVSAILVCIFGLSIPPILSVGMLSIMGIDWLIQQIGWKESTNIRRLITGTGGGFGLFSLFLFCFGQIWEWLI